MISDTALGKVISSPLLSIVQGRPIVSKGVEDASHCHSHATGRLEKHSTRMSISLSHRPRIGLHTPVNFVTLARDSWTVLPFFQNNKRRLSRIMIPWSRRPLSAFRAYFRALSCRATTTTSRTSNKDGTERSSIRNTVTRSAAHCHDS